MNMKLRTGENSRVRRKIITVSVMISMYCRAKHGSIALCKQCSDIREYSIEKIWMCKIKTAGTSCSSCKVHCFSDSFREQIREVMRYSGPRMIFSHPILAIRHLIGR